MALNSGQLEVELFCKGIRIDESCTLEEDARLFARTRAGLGSGLEMIIPGDLKDLWVNVPVEEDFAQLSPYQLVKKGEDYFVEDTREKPTLYQILLPKQPSWYTRKTSRGTPMSKVGVLQGTYLGIYISNSCLYWYQNPSKGCKFCTTGLNVGVNEVADKEIDDVVEVAVAAKEESGNTFVHFNSGYQAGRGLDIAAPYVKAIKGKVGALVGLQIIPEKDLWKYDWLIDLGADHFSFCYEFHNPEYFARYLPGKQETVGQKTFFNAMEYTSKKLGKGRCSGEIIAGVEPIEDTIKAIDYITGIGCFPTVCIFRPVIGSEMENFPPPPYEDMVHVMAYMYESCKKNGIPIGITPNIEVSLIVNPDDAKYLVQRDLSWHLYEFRNRFLKFISKPYFSYKMKPKIIKVDANDSSPYRPHVPSVENAKSF